MSKNVSARGWSAVEAEPKQKPVITPVGSTAVSKREPLVPSYAVGPADVGPSGEPSVSPALGVPNGHRRGVQGLVGRRPALHHPRQVQGHPLDGLGIEAHEAVELGAIGQGRECVPELSVA